MRVVPVSIGRYVVIVPVKYVRRAVSAAVCAFVVAMLWFLAIAPPLLGFAVAVGLALAWCIWLERHPEPAADSAPTHVAETGDLSAFMRDDASPPGARRLPRP